MIWSEVNGQSGAWAPVGGDLQNRGAADAAVGEQQLVAEDWFSVTAIDGDAHFGRDAAEAIEAAAVFAVEDERDERGAGFDDAVAEAKGDGVADAGGADLRDGEAAGRDDDFLCVQGWGRRGWSALRGSGFNKKACAGLRDGCDGGAEVEIDTGCFSEKHVHDLAGGAVAEQLAWRFGVMGDAVLVDERYKCVGRVAGEGGLGEVRVFREEVLRLRIEVGEVGAASPGDEDLAAGFAGVVEQRDA